VEPIAPLTLHFADEDVALVAVVVGPAAHAIEQHLQRWSGPVSWCRQPQSLACGPKVPESWEAAEALAVVLSVCSTPCVVLEPAQFSGGTMLLGSSRLPGW
jgi:hypothetical protein